MTLKPCIVCGTPSSGSRCAEHRLQDTRTNRSHVAWRNDSRWKSLSQKLRRAAPFCEGCFTRDDLTTDHVLPVSEYPELTYSVENCRVLCRSCNGRRGNRFTLEDAAGVLARLEVIQKRRPTARGRERVNAAQRAVQATRGVAPGHGPGRPVGKAQSALHTQGNL